MSAVTKYIISPTNDPTTSLLIDERGVPVRKTQDTVHPYYFNTLEAATSVLLRVDDFYSCTINAIVINN